MSPTYLLVRQAILNKQQVHAIYNGKRRALCPHVIGRNGGREQALFYQFAGGSNTGLSSNPGENWRCLFLDSLSRVEVRDGDWHTGPNHSRPQSCVSEVDEQVWL